MAVVEASFSPKPFDAPLAVRSSLLTLGLGCRLPEYR